MGLSQATLEKILAKMDDIDAAALKPKKDPGEPSPQKIETSSEDDSPVGPKDGPESKGEAKDEDEDELSELMELYGKKSGKLD